MATGSSGAYVILVTGSRLWTNEQRLRCTLLEASKGRGTIRLVHGGTRGADLLARKIAVELGWQFKVYRPEWKRYGKQNAPYECNNEILAKEKVDLVLAFPTKKSRGTYDMILKARRARIDTIVNEANIEY